MRARKNAWVTAVMALIAALPLCACGGNAKPSQTPALSPSMLGGVGIAAATTPDTSAQAAEVLAAQAPEGVDPALWEMLRDELVRELGEKAGKRNTSAINTDLPMNSYYRGVGMGWDDEFMRADGSGNGIVDIGDLSTIAMHYHKHTPSYSSSSKVADYNNDGFVSLGDVTALALSYGMSCIGFRTEYSTEGEDSGFAAGGFVSYSDYRIQMPNFPTDRRLYEYPSDTANENPYWMRVWAVDKDGEDFGYHTFEAPITRGTYPPTGGPVLEILPGESAAITWDTKSLMMADGNQDGTSNFYDVAFISELYSTNTMENPQYSVMDYDDSGEIGVSDVIRVASSFMHGVDNYLIEISTESADSGYVMNGTVMYLESTGFNIRGFRYYEYAISSPPVSVPYWVRVTPVGANGALGTPSTAVEIAP